VVDGVGSLGDTHLHVAIDTETRLTAHRLRDALDRLALRLPRLRSRFRFRFFRCRWLPDPGATWTIDEQTVADEAAARAAEDALFALPFEPHGTLPVRAVLLHLPGRDRLLLRVNHLLADGGGTKNLCYRLAAHYRECAGGPAAPLVRRAPHPWWRLLASLSLRRVPALLYGVLEELRTIRPKRPIGPPMSEAEPGTARFELLHIDRERTARLVERWRPERVTLNELALCAWSRAVAGSFPEANPPGRDAMVVVTTDLRRFEFRRRDDVSNYSDLRPIFLGRTPLPEPEEQLQEVVRASRRWKRGLTGLLVSCGVISPLVLIPDGVLRALLVRGLGLLTGGGPCTALTNIGPIDAERLDFGDGPCLAARVSAPIGRPPLLLSALTGCAGALDLTIAYRDAAFAPEQARRLAEAFDLELRSLS